MERLLLLAVIQQTGTVPGKSKNKNNIKKPFLLFRVIRAPRRAGEWERTPSFADGQVGKDGQAPGARAAGEAAIGAGEAGLRARQAGLRACAASL
jgi:hypothetical protein